MLILVVVGSRSLLQCHRLVTLGTKIRHTAVRALRQRCDKILFTLPCYLSFRDTARWDGSLGESQVPCLAGDPLFEETQQIHRRPKEQVLMVRRRHQLAILSGHGCATRTQMVFGCWQTVFLWCRSGHIMLPCQRRKSRAMRRVSVCERRTLTSLKVEK